MIGQNSSLKESINVGDGVFRCSADWTWLSLFQFEPKVLCCLRSRRFGKVKAAPGFFHTCKVRG